MRRYQAWVRSSELDVLDRDGSELEISEAGTRSNAPPRCITDNTTPVRASPAITSITSIR